MKEFPWWALNLLIVGLTILFIDELAHLSNSMWQILGSFYGNIVICVGIGAAIHLVGRTVMRGK